MVRTLAALVFVVLLLAPGGTAEAHAVWADDGSLGRQAPGAGGTLYFPETGFAIDEPHFADYFNHRGQVPTFGFPISRTIRFRDLPTQFFQRVVIQLWPDGSVRPLNLLDPGLLPYTHINGSTFPAPNERLAAYAPSPDQPGYAREVLEFVKQNAPETFNGQPVRFFSTFNSTVTAETAFPRGTPGDPSLLPLINLEIWGVPTSLPMQDPNNGGFIYQRFQRGIMHYDASCRCTQGLLLADYFKALVTGENLPPDLAAEAAGSPFLKQYAADKPSGLARPAALPGTDLSNAFVKMPATAVAATAPAAPSRSVTAPAVAASGPPPNSFRARIRVGDGLGPAVDVLEAANITAPLQAILDSGTEIAFGQLDENVHARYSRVGSSRGAALRRIVVSMRWLQADPKAIATLLVHEATHLADDLAGVDPRTPDACYQFEVLAFTKQSIAWQTFYGPGGKPQPKDDLDTELNTWLALYRKGVDQVQARVQQWYVQECAQPARRIT
jgi:hypothetical protein